MTKKGGLRKACAALAAVIGVLCCARSAIAEVSLKVEDKGRGVYRVEGFFSVSAPSAAAWGVLTDYNGIPRFVPSLIRSRVKERRDAYLLLEQEALGKAFFFRRTIHVLLEVRERPFESITFKDISQKDFDSYEGSWGIKENGRGLLITYRLEAKRKFMAPDFIAKSIFRKNAASLLSQIRSEILRRTGRT